MIQNWILDASIKQWFLNLLWKSFFGKLEWCLEYIFSGKFLS